LITKAFYQGIDQFYWRTNAI